MCGQVCSMLVFLPLFFGADPQTSQTFVNTVERPIQSTLEFDLTKSGKSFPWSKNDSNKWIYLGWMWSSNSTSNTLHLTYEPRPTLSWLREPVWNIGGGALILGEPDSDR
jgi:hypothetical protein